MKKRFKALLSSRIFRVCILLFIAAVLVFTCTPPGAAMWKSLLRTAQLLPFAQSLPEDELFIHVLNVGKADAILIEGPDAALLLDTATAGDSDTVLRYLEARGVTELDAVWLSHADNDHTGGLPLVSKHLPVGAVYGQNPSAPYQTVCAGESYLYGDLALEVLQASEMFEGTNDNSLVLRLTYKDFSMLFCGDIETAAEEALLSSGQSLSADVLKVAHHGSGTSTTEDFLRAVNPAYAVISTGPDRNRLPRNAVLRRLTDSGTEIYRTDLDGTVVFSINGARLHITTENGGTIK